MDAVAPKIEAVGDGARAHLLHARLHRNTAFDAAGCRPLISFCRVTARWADPNAFFSHCVVPFGCGSRGQSLMCYERLVVWPSIRRSPTASTSTTSLRTGAETCWVSWIARLLTSTSS